MEKQLKSSACYTAPVNQKTFEVLQLSAVVEGENIKEDGQS